MQRRRPAAHTGLAVALGTLVVAVFGSAVGHDFAFDDSIYVLGNPHVRGGINLASLRWAFTTTYAGFWHPLTWVSHLIDVELFGMNPAGHHATNVLLHALNALLLFHVLRRATGSTWRSALAVALFAVHPLRAESVAWVAERKDLLSAFFFSTTLAAYLTYAEKPGVGRYGLVMASFTLGLMSKPMVVTLPFVLLLLDYWPLGRAAAPGWGWRRLVVEKLPLLLLVVVASAVAYGAQAEYGAVSGAAQYPLPVRLMNAAYSYAMYLRKTVWPGDLAAFYPHPGFGLSRWAALASALALGAATLVVVRRRGAQPYLPVGWLWFAGMLVPVIGIVQLGDMGMADRFTYLPHVGLFLALSWSFAAVTRRLRLPARASAAISGGAILALAALCVHQVGYWRDDSTLFLHALEVTEGNPLAHNNLAHAFLERGELSEAEPHLREAIRLDPTYVDAYLNLGRLYALAGRAGEAEDFFRRTLQLDSRNALAQYNWGTLLAEGGDSRGAEEHLRAAVRLDPLLAPARFNLGVLLASTGRVGEARAQLEDLLRLDPTHRGASAALAALRAEPSPSSAGGLP